MEQIILNGVGKKMRLSYLNGQVSESAVMAMYRKNKKEADSFSVYGFRMHELERFARETHNPLLREKLQACLEQKRKLSKKSSDQNQLSLSKLENFKKTACGIGLRKVIKHLDKLSKITKDPETILIQMLLETEYANLSAKQHKGRLKGVIYERKSILLYQMADLLESMGWKYGINSDTGKNACYLVYIYLPNGVQLTWHCNEYAIYESYPPIDAEWDGQVCMTMEKILTYINRKYFDTEMAA
jgi:hypothetical protein